MKRMILFLGFTAPVLLLAAALSGCYTELSRNDRGFNSDYGPPPSDSSYSYDQGGQYMDEGGQYEKIGRAHV